MLQYVTLSTTEKKTPHNITNAAEGLLAVSFNESSDRSQNQEKGQIKTVSPDDGRGYGAEQVSELCK